MSKYKIIIFITVVLLAINTTLLAFLWIGKKQEPAPIQGGPAVVEKLLSEKLSLTQDQLKQFRILRGEHFMLNQKLLDSLRVQKDVLFSMLGKEETGSPTVDSIMSIIAVIEKKKDGNTFSHFSKVRAILQPGQQKNFDNIINEILRMVAGPQPGNRRPPPFQGDGPPPGGERPPPPGEAQPPN